MPDKKLTILDKNKIRQITERMAYQILENNYEEKELIVAGIQDNGFLFAEKLSETLKSLSKIKVTLTSIALNKLSPLENEINHELEKVRIDSKPLIIVDDVANTGKTLFYALKPVMEFHPKKVQIAVLIDREHKLFPVHADYIGISLSTTLQEHIFVDLKKTNETAYLS